MARKKFNLPEWGVDMSDLSRRSSRRKMSSANARKALLRIQQELHAVIEASPCREERGDDVRRLVHNALAKVSQLFVRPTSIRVCGNCDEEVPPGCSGIFSEEPECLLHKKK